jgi:hypothetical protein
LDILESITESLATKSDHLKLSLELVSVGLINLVTMESTNLPVASLEEESNLVSALKYLDFSCRSKTLLVNRETFELSQISALALLSKNLVDSKCDLISFKSKLFINFSKNVDFLKLPTLDDQGCLISGPPA